MGLSEWESRLLSICIAYISVIMLLSSYTHCTEDRSQLHLQKLVKSFCWLGCLLPLPCGCSLVGVNKNTNAIQIPSHFMLKHIVQSTCHKTRYPCSWSLNISLGLRPTTQFTHYCLWICIYYYQRPSPFINWMTKCIIKDLPILRISHHGILARQ